MSDAAVYGSAPTEELGTVMLDQLAVALAAFQAEMPTILKNHTASVRMKEGGTYSYTYADLADITEAAMPLLTKHGLAFISLPGAGQLTGMLLHKSGQHVTGSLPINGSTPQQLGSSLTYMRRYLLGCMTGIVTDDDDDGRGAQPAATRPRKKKEAEPPPPPPTDEELGIPTGAHAAEKKAAKATAKQVQRIAILATDLGLDRPAKLAGVAATIGRDVASTKELTPDEASSVIDSLKAALDARGGEK